MGRRSKHSVRGKERLSSCAIRGRRDRICGLNRLVQIELVLVRNRQGPQINLPEEMTTICLRTPQKTKDKNNNDDKPLYYPYREEHVDVYIYIYFFFSFFFWGGGVSLSNW